MPFVRPSVRSKTHSCALHNFDTLRYLVGMKKRTSRRVACKRDNSYYLLYVVFSWQKFVQTITPILFEIIC